MKALNAALDEQTPSPFYIDDTLCTGEEERGTSSKRRYVQAYKLEVEHAGTRLRVMLRPDHIELSWERTDRPVGTVVLQPASFQQARLFAPRKEDV